MEIYKEAVEQSDRIMDLRRSIMLTGSGSSRPSPLLTDGTWQMILQFLSCVRFIFRPMPEHSWIVLFDSKRVTIDEGETSKAFLNRVGRTNRNGSILNILGGQNDDVIILVDAATPFTRHDSHTGYLPFLLRAAGLSGAIGLAINFLRAKISGYGILQSAMIASLSLFAKLKQRPRNGVIFLTSVTWIAEVTRLGFARQGKNFDIVEILHGAGSQKMIEYFVWLHGYATSNLRYVNVIAGLPRFEPLQSALVEDESGEISCNIKLWSQINFGEAMPVSMKTLSSRQIAFIGGGSHEAHYIDGPYFARECEMIKHLSKQGYEIAYCPHPQHSSAMIQQMIQKANVDRLRLSLHSTMQTMLSSRAVIGGFSTSLFEAHLMEIPVFSYEDLDAMFISDLSRLVPQTSNFQKLAETLALHINQQDDLSAEQVFNKRVRAAIMRFGLNLNPVEQ